MNTHDIETTRKWLQQQPVISIIPHKNPDGDAIGSCLGLCLYLRQLQLNATVVSPNDFPEFLKWLPAVDDIIIYDNDQERAKTQIEASTLIFTLDFNSLKPLSPDGSLWRFLEHSS